MSVRRVAACGPPPAGALPTVSVVIPCFNYGHFLAGCLDSVLSQDGVRVSVLVIDDRSTDGSDQLAARVCAEDPRVTLCCHRENTGLIATANEGLEWASGDYVVLLSADDQLVPGSLARATSVMEAEPTVGLVYGRPLLAPEGRPIPMHSGSWRRTDVWSGVDWIAGRCRSAHNAMSSPEVVVRTRTHRAAGGYDTACTHASDLNMWLRIAAISDVAYVRGVPQAVYRVHSDSMQRSQRGPLSDLVERRIAFDAFFASAGAQLENSSALAGCAHRALARQALWRASRIVDHGRPGGQEWVESLVGFALETDPGARHLREWRGLGIRRSIGPGRSRAFVPFAVTGAAHRLGHHAARARWRLRGV